MRDLAPTLHAEEEVAAIAATTVEQTSRLEQTNRMDVPTGRTKLPTIEDIPIDVETPSERPPKRDIHDEPHTVEMRTILKRGK